MNVDAAARIDELRLVIDELDRDIVQLLARRTTVVMELTEYKTDEDSVRSLDRVRAVIDKVRRLAMESEMPPQVAEAVYRALIEELTAMQMTRLAARRAAASR